MKITRIVALAIAPFAIAACEQEAERTGEMADSIIARDGGANAGQSLSADTVVASADQGMQVSLVLNAVGGSGVTGEATIAPGEGQQTRVDVTLNATGQGGVHQGHIHQGTCAALGAAVVPLQPVTTAGGTGSATSNVAVDAMSVMDGQHVIGYHQAGAQPGAAVACGEIPGHTM
jgi:hypothetical protein